VLIHGLTIHWLRAAASCTLFHEERIGMHANFPRRLPACVSILH
jgi:hypothetical protein